MNAHLAHVGTIALLRVFVAAGVLIACCMGLTAPTMAQSPLDQRLVQLEQQVTQVAQQLPGGVAPGTAALPQNYAAQVEVRLSDLEIRVQRLLGAIEQIQFNQRTLNDRIDRAVADFDFRLRRLEGDTEAATTVGATQGLATPLPTTAGAADRQPIDRPPIGDTYQQWQVVGADRATGSNAAGSSGLAPSAGTLGTLRVQAPAGGQIAAAPSDPITAQYDQAFGRLQAQDYSGAEGMLRAFVEQHSDHPLASNAQYWLGETFYARGRFNDAAAAFARGYQTYPSGSKAVDSLLKLGMSLAVLDQRDNACLALSQVNTQFPDAPTAVRRRADLERDRLQCPS